MTKEIICNQFIHGKLSSAERAIYEPIAWSPGLEKDDISSIYTFHNNIRPSSIKIPSFSGGVACSFIPDGRLVILKIQKSAEKESGRNYYLYQRYYIFENDVAIDNIGDIFQFIFNIPEPITISNYKNDLSNKVVLERSIRNIFAIEYLTATNDNVLQKSLLGALHYYLNSKPVLIRYQENSNFNISTWLFSFGSLLPHQFLKKLRLYIGDHAPIGWNANLLFSTLNVSYGRFNIFDINQPNENWPTLEKLDPSSYTKLVYRIFKSQKDDLIEKLVQTQITKNNLELSSVDLEIGKAAMPTIGLELIRFMIHNDLPIYLEDIIWLWRNTYKHLDEADVEYFLTMMLLDRTDEWNEFDIKSFDTLLDKHESAVTRVFENVLANQSVNTQDQIKEFITVWTNYSEVNTINQIELIIFLLNSLQNWKPENLTKLFIKILVKTPISFRFELAFSVLKNTLIISESQFWDIIVLLTASVRDENDIGKFVLLLGNFPKSEPAETLEKIFIFFLNQIYTNQELYSLLRSFLSLIFRVPAKEKIVAGFIHIIIQLENNDMLINLTPILIQKKLVTRNLQKFLFWEKEYIWDIYSTWIFETLNAKVIGSYYMLVMKTGFCSIGMEIIFDVLTRNPSLFNQVINVLIKEFQIEKKDIHIDNYKFTQLEPTDLLITIYNYVCSTHLLGDFDLSEFALYEKTFLELENLFKLPLSIDNLVYLYRCFKMLNAWKICLVIGEIIVKIALVNRKVMLVNKFTSDMMEIHNNIKVALPNNLVSDLFFNLLVKRLISLLYKIDDEQRKDFLLALLSNVSVDNLDLKKYFYQIEKRENTKGTKYILNTLKHDIRFRIKLYEKIVNSTHLYYWES